MNAPPLALIRMPCCHRQAAAIMDRGDVRIRGLHRAGCRTQHDAALRRRVDDAILEQLAAFWFVPDYFGVGDLPVRHRYAGVIA